MKKIVNRVLWISSLLIVLVLLIWTNIEQANSHCSDIKVQMTSGGEASLVSPDAIRSDILENMPALIGQSFKNVALEDLEKHVSANTQLSEVKTYLNLNGLINIKVSPRKAILRLYDDRGENLYLGSEKVLMNPSLTQSKRIMVANGHIPHLMPAEKIQVLNKEKDLPEIYSQLYVLAEKIHEDAFLDALIDQIYVTKHQELILTPKVGVRKIFFGKAKNIDEKLFNLKAFYLHGKSKIDWQKYSSINIKYRNQIVCSKK